MEQREAALVVGVDQLVGRRRHLGQDGQPGERVLLGELPAPRQRDDLAADAVEAVAAGHEVAVQLVLGPRVGEADDRGIGRDALGTHVGHLETDGAAGLEARRDQVLHDLLVAVDGDALSGQLREVDALALAVELQDDPVVHGAFGQHAPAHTAVAQQVDRPCSRTPARTRVSTEERARFSRTTLSTPARCNRCDSMRSAGPAPTIPTCVRMLVTASAPVSAPGSGRRRR
jgi:hypothetical protein